MGTRYGAFLDSYNRGNTFFERITQGFFDKIKYDIDELIDGDTPYLKQRFKQISELGNDPHKNSYEKIMGVANVLEEVLGIEISPLDQKYILNIVYKFMDVAKESEDQLVIDTSLKLASQVIKGLNTIDEPKVKVHK
jgi:hypothetical protein